MSAENNPRRDRAASRGQEAEREQLKRMVDGGWTDARSGSRQCEDVASSKPQAALTGSRFCVVVAVCHSLHGSLATMVALLIQHTKVLKQRTTNRGERVPRATSSPLLPQPAKCDAALDPGPTSKNAVVVSFRGYYVVSPVSIPSDKRRSQFLLRPTTQALPFYLLLRTYRISPFCFTVRVHKNIPVVLV